VTGDAVPELRLQVARARPHDVGHGVARLSGDALRALGLAEGDVIEVSGRRRTAAIALLLPAEDRGLEILRIDGVLRSNASVGIGDQVGVRCADVVAADRVRLAPAAEGPRLTGSADALRRTLLHRAIVAGDVVTTSIGRGDRSSGLRPQTPTSPAFGLQEIRLRVVGTSPEGIVRIAERTELELVAEPVSTEWAPHIVVSYEDLGGLDEAITQVREMVELPLKHPELFDRLGIDPPKGVLLHGPPGTGKTLLARAVADEASARFFSIGGPEIVGPYIGESEQRLREVFERASESGPAIVFIDEIDAIAPKRDVARGETERRLVAQLLTLMDGLKPRRTIVIGATNLPDALDEALRRPGRFDREIAVGVPDRKGRRDVLAIHTRGMPLAPDVDLDALAASSHGFVGADLAALAREAAMDAARRSLAGVNLAGGQLPSDVVQRIQVTAADFANARRRVHPSAMREILVQVPAVRWEDIGGLDSAVRTLRDGIELPLRHPDAFQRVGVRPARGFLLFGPPGTGKTLLAKAVAREAEANFIAAKASDLLSKWYGESERQVARLFARARQVAPTVMFLDELDALAPERGSGPGDSAVSERVVNTLLAELDGLEELSGVVVIGATNRPTLIDAALLRPGRFDELVYVPVPDRRGRRKILGIHTARMPLGPDVNLDAIADRTPRFTGADLEGLVRRAGLYAFRQSIEVAAVPMACFERALAESHASVSEEVEREYESLLQELKRESPTGRRRIGFLADRPAASPPPTSASRESRPAHAPSRSDLSPPTG
jgi:transitional endoplasmic reticulum ATPase